MQAKKILIIEDEKEVSSILSAKLLKEGYLVSVARNGMEGLQMFENDLADLILLDIMMPGLDGIQTLKRLRATEGGSAVPVIILTNVPDVSKISEAMEGNVYDYMIKSDESLQEIVTRIAQRLQD